MASSYLHPPSPRRRVTAIVLTLLVHLLLLVLLLRLGPRQYVPMGRGGALSTFTVAAPAEQRQRAAARPRERQRAAAARAQPAPPKPPPIVFKDTSGTIWLDKDQFAASDIAKAARARDPGETATAANDAGADGDDGDSKAAYGPGAGPGGKRLYAAEWYREPTDAELRTYLPPVPPGSWGAIGCRTVPEYRVEDCQTLEESPRGSRIATGLRRAAWQFRVRPPRIGGKPQYGAWVRIVIEFTDRGAAVKR